MHGRDMRPWLVKDPHWTPVYVPQPQEKMPARISLDALEHLLDAAAFGGSSAFADICFDVDSRER